jgi:homoserine O-acetyltransferase/O-succinyltransferase
MSKGVGTVSTRFLTFGSADEPFVTADGGALSSVTIAYEAYGELNATRSNAILLFHALSGSQHAAGTNTAVPGTDGRWTEENHHGWWDGFIGPGRALDTSKYFVICANYLGSCYGSTGPASLDPSTGKPYGSRFPRVSIHDIVRSQIPVLEHLGIEKLHAVVGASLGGMCALDFAFHFPERVSNVIPIASGLRAHGLQQMHNLEQIIAITRDPDFRGGDYYGTPGPMHGLALARMISHKTFFYADVLEERARVDIVQPEVDIPWYRISSVLESYMLYQGQKFVRRFDANSYLRIIDAWQQFDLYKDAKSGGVHPLFSRCASQHYLVFTIDSDCCFYPDYQSEICNELKKAGVPHLRLTVHSEKGHDSFLLEPKLYTPHLAYALGH